MRSNHPSHRRTFQPRLAFAPSVLICLGWLGGIQALRADPPDLNCGSLLEDAARLACYDQRFSTRAAPLPVPPPLVAFGLTDEQERIAAAVDNPTPEIDHSSVRVATLEKRSTGEMLVTLENGQVWGQSELYRRARVRAGDTVIIRRAALGSFLLVTEDGIGTRVKRLK